MGTLTLSWLLYDSWKSGMSMMAPAGRFIAEEQKNGCSTVRGPMESITSSCTWSVREEVGVALDTETRSSLIMRVGTAVMEEHKV